MPGPGGRGRRGRGGHRGGFRHAPLPPPPPRPGMFFGGVAGGPAYRGGGHPHGPRGLSCCCWVWICLIGFIVISSVGITLIDFVAGCNTSATSDGDDETSQSSCYQYELGFAITVGLVALCCCCCLMRPSDGSYSPMDGSEAERQHMLATEADPPPIAYADRSSNQYQSLPRATEYQTTKV